MSRVDQLRKLVQLAPADPFTHYGLGLEFIQLERWREAIAAFAEAIRVDPKYAVAFYHKARAEIGGGEADAARATLGEGTRVAKSLGDAHTEMEMQALLESIE